ncbi:MAG TPA: hypothetical protein VIH04_08710 [Nitrosarchaeum sp.]
MQYETRIDMISQYVWIVIIVGVFFAGIGIGYAALQSNTTVPMMMTPQQMQQMMNNPKQMTQWHQTMMDNPQAMNNWMNAMMQNPNMMNQWMGTMMNDPNMMNNMMAPMMNDPQFSQQMYGMMFQNQQFMQNMMNNTQFQNQWMMNPSMMRGNMMGSMMGTPITKQSDVITTINKIESILDQVSSSYRSGDKDTAFSQATSAYLENYEYVESAIAAKDLKQMEKIELLLRVDLRNIIQNNESADNVDAKIDAIKTELASVKKLFS